MPCRAAKHPQGEGNQGAALGDGSAGAGNYRDFSAAHVSCLNTKADEGIVLTCNGYTKEAQKYAKAKQPWRRSQGIARRPKSTAPAAAARGSAALPATVPTATRRQHGGRRNAQSALRRRDAGMTIEEMRAKALECTSLYFPDLRWSQPEFQDALAAFFHYILTGAWPPSDHVQMTIGQEDAKKATCTTAPDREFEAAGQRRA
jgi:hypothetical protein